MTDMRFAAPRWYCGAFRWLAAAVTVAAVFGAAGLSSAPAWAEGGAPGLKYPHYDSPADIPGYVFSRSPTTDGIHISPDGTHVVIWYHGDDDVHFEVLPLGKEPPEPHMHGQIDDWRFETLNWANNSRLIMETHGMMVKMWGVNVPVPAGDGMIGINRTGGKVDALITATGRNYREAATDTDMIHRLPKSKNLVLISHETPKSGGYPGVYTLDVYTGDLQLVEPPMKPVRTWVADNEGNVRFGFGVDDKGLVLMARAKPGGEWHDLSNNELFKEGGFFPVGFDDHPGTVLVRSAIANGRFALYRMDLNTGSLVEKIFEDPNADVAGVVIAPDTHKLVAVTYVDDRYRYHFFDKDFEVMIKSIDKALPGRNNYIVDATEDGRYYLFFSESDTYPGAFYRFDRKAREFRLFSEVNGELDPNELSPMKSVRYFARDGVEISAVVTVPKDAAKGPLPAVVLPHTSTNGHDFIQYNYVVQFLASRGIAVIQPNYRGSSGNGFAFQSLAVGQWGKGMQTDLADAAQYLIDQGIADPKRICIVGTTYGGYAALIGIIQNPDLFACAAAISPIVDLKEGLTELRRQNKAIYQQIVGDRSRKEMSKLSPMQMTQEMHRPVLLLTDENKETTRFLKELDKHKVDHTFVALKNTSPDFGINRMRSLYALETFLHEKIGIKLVADKPDTKKADAH